MTAQTPELTVSVESPKRRIIDLTAMAAWVGLDVNEFMERFSLNDIPRDRDIKAMLTNAAMVHGPSAYDEDERHHIFCRAAHFFVHEAPTAQNSYQPPKTFTAISGTREFP